METEKIDVPKFDGHECIGMQISHGEDDIYVLNANGDGLNKSSDLIPFLQTITLLCYQKIKPKRFVFETTGEYRPPKIGEFYVSPLGIFQQADNNYSNPRAICKAVEE